MSHCEETSRRMASLASRAVRDPASLTLDEIASLGGALLTQAPNRNALLTPPGAHAYYNPAGDRPNVLAQYSRPETMAKFLQRGS